ncbi:MAG TPA: class I SAM-dependent methyltransferase [Levilinea sp.]|nr:class I SAM-dependent methyltransferase [Levilinea sp.]
MQASEEIRPGNLLKLLLKGFFHLLYHPFAGLYDLVAAAVSAGRWVKWVYQVEPYLAGERILELGHGTGHLQARLFEHGMTIFGIDRSSQMGRIARRRLYRKHAQPRLARATASALPFAPASFSTIVATFPAEYIADPNTLREIQRILAPGGRLVVLLSAWITGGSLLDRALAALFNVTGESQPASSVSERSLHILHLAGFAARFEWIDIASSRLLILIAETSD